MRILDFCGILVAVFLLIWSLTYLFHKKKVPVAAYLIRAASAIVIAASIYFTILYFHSSASGSTKGWSNMLGTFSFLWGIAAAFIFAGKALFQWLRRLIDEQDVVRRILLLTKNHHNLLGWVTLIAASGHGVYYLLYPYRSSYEFYTGIAAWIPLVLLAATGKWMQKAVRHPAQAKLTRMSHRLLTATYLIVIFLHFRGGIIITGLLLLCALAAIMVLWSVLYVLRLVRRRPE